MAADRFSRICLLTIICLLALVALRPIFNPQISANAARNYRYELVRVSDDQTAEQARMALDKYSRDGWELVAAPFFVPAPGNWASGYLIFRKADR